MPSSKLSGPPHLHRLLMTSYLGVPAQLCKLFMRNKDFYDAEVFKFDAHALFRFVFQMCMCFVKKKKIIQNGLNRT